tara:strand:+ start:20 stop:646 length:627 start_codon:yes stop_codon:yes gene_type:complete
MPVTISGNGIITGLAVGGLPDGTVDEDTLANLAVSTGKIANSAVTSAKASGLGIGDIDVWRLTAGNTGDQTPISANWARNNEAGTSLLGSGMTQSSGVFTFPSTGHWLIRFNHHYRVNGNERYANSDIQITTDGGSNWDEVSRQGGNITAVDSNTTAASANPSVIFDVTNTTNCKVRFCAAFSNDSVQSVGASDIAFTYATFIKLADT